MDSTQEKSADLRLRNMKESCKVSTWFSCYLEESILHSPGVNADKVIQAPKFIWLQEFFYLDIQPKLILLEPQKPIKTKGTYKLFSFYLSLSLSLGQQEAFLSWGHVEPSGWTSALSSSEFPMVWWLKSGTIITLGRITTQFPHKDVTEYSDCTKFLD